MVRAAGVLGDRSRGLGMQVLWEKGWGGGSWV